MFNYRGILVPPISVFRFVSRGLSVFPPRYRIVGKRVRVEDEHPLAHMLNKEQGYFLSRILFLAISSLLLIPCGVARHGHIVEVECVGRDPV